MQQHTDKVVIIAEAGVNHNGDVELARKLIDVAEAAGADYVKFQTYRADRVVTAKAPKATYQLAATPGDENQIEMLRGLELTDTEFTELWSICSKKRVRFLSTPFDTPSADFLARLGVDRFKIPSGELVNIPFLEHVGGLGLPVILSTGMSDLEEVRAGVGALEKAGCRDISILHCLTNYPANPAEANLRAMHTMAEEFGYPVGFSDHTPGIAVSLAAVALGARIIEKHFTLDRSLPGPDHAASLEGDELKQLVDEIRIVESALGDGQKVPAKSELAIRTIARKSVVAATHIPAGTAFSAANLTVKRPGTGLPPAQLRSLFGEVARCDIEPDTLLTKEMIR